MSVGRSPTPACPVFAGAIWFKFKIGVKALIVISSALPTKAQMRLAISVFSGVVCIPAGRSWPPQIHDFLRSQVFTNCVNPT